MVKISKTSPETTLKQLAKRGEGMPGKFRKHPRNARSSKGRERQGRVGGERLMR